MSQRIVMMKKLMKPLCLSLLTIVVSSYFTISYAANNAGSSYELSLTKFQLISNSPFIEELSQQNLPFIQTSFKNKSHNPFDLSAFELSALFNDKLQSLLSALKSTKQEKPEVIARAKTITSGCTKPVR